MLKTTLVTIIQTLVFATAVSTCVAQSTSGRPSPGELFDQRIMPIFRSPEPSSCVQCHLASVDLKSYILPSQEQTFAALRDQGLIDVESPEKSKILTLIRMGDKDLDEGARLIHATTRQAEYDAFAAWIRACCDDPGLRDLPSATGEERAGPERPDAVIRHARKSRVVDSFVRKIWSQRMRCFPCHTPHEIDASNPRHQVAIKKQKEFEEQYGSELMARLRIFRETPEATMQYLIEQSRQTPEGGLPLINLENPSKSLIVLKPTSKLPKKLDDGKFAQPSSIEPVSHMGGLKMHPNDQSYKAFISWIQDYANVVGDRYASVNELPLDNWHASKLVLKVANAPEEWPVGTPVQLFVHAWDNSGQSWSAQAIAFTQGTVTPRRMVNGALFLLASDDPAEQNGWDRESGTLPKGRYLVKTYIDSRQKLAEDPAILLGEDDFVGQVEIPKARWREGFRFGEKVSGKRLVTQ